MRKKALLIGIGITAIVYALAFSYIFLISPILLEQGVPWIGSIVPVQIKELPIVRDIVAGVEKGYISNWFEKELSKKAKYKENEVCGECHKEYLDLIISSNHSSLACESCHGVGEEHSKLRTAWSIVVDRSRDACMSCHLNVSGREAIVTVDENHYPGVKCVVCHDAHDPLSISWSEGS
ncbi:MAG: multiheme c-type cytochrome [Archaeoglobaceae archaeon]